MSNVVRSEVVVVNVNMPFWSMVRFMVKWAIAAIPAFVILTVIGAVLSVAFAALVGHAGHRMWL
jgi:hypothetical protein